MGMAWWPCMLGGSCAGQMFAQHESMAFKELHYHLYMAQVWCTGWHYLWALSSYVATAEKLPPPPSSWEQECLSRAGGDWQKDQQAMAQKVQLQAKQNLTPQHSISALSSPKG